MYRHQFPCPFVRFSPMSILRRVQNILLRELSGFYSFGEVSVTAFDFERLSGSSGLIFANFSFTCLFDGVRFRCSQVLVIFLFSECFSDLEVLFFSSFLFPLFHYQHIIFSKSIPVSWWYIFIVYARVFISDKYLMIKISICSFHFLIGLYFSFSFFFFPFYSSYAMVISQSLIL